MTSTYLGKILVSAVVSVVSVAEVVVVASVTAARGSRYGAKFVKVSLQMPRLTGSTILLTLSWEWIMNVVNQ